MKRLSDWIIARLTRVTSSGRFVPEVDGLRFMAIMAVVVYHLQKHVFPVWTHPSNLPGAALTGGQAMLANLRGVINTGWIGVQLFFIISGFILSMPFAEHHLLGARKPTLGKYFLRRVTRLEPPYILNLAILLCLTLWMNAFTVSIPQTPPANELMPHFFASLFYGHNLIYGTQSWINNVAWTLEIEVQFYILAPLLSLVFLVRNNAVRRGIIVAGVAAGCLFGHWRSTACEPGLAEILGMTLLGQFKYFLLGFLLADLYLVDWNKAPKKAWKWDIVGLAAWVLIPFTLPTEVFWLDGAWPVHLGWRFEYFLPGLMLLAYVAAFRGRLLNAIFRYGWITAIGGMCYTIYLYHNTIIFLMTKQWGGADLSFWFVPDGVIRTLFLLFGVIVCGSAMFVLFERPFMKRDWPRWVWQQARLLPLRAWALWPRGLARQEAVAQDTEADSFDRR